MTIDHSLIQRYVTPETFLPIMKHALTKHKHAASVHVPKLSDLQGTGTVCVLLDYGRAGYVVYPDHTLNCVFHNPVSAIKDVLGTIMPSAIQDGATKLDCFEGFLSEAYAKHGFVEVKREPWDQEKAPAHWNEAHGTPDLIYMELGHTAQETFDHVVNHLRTQGNKCYLEPTDDAPGGCQYKGQGESLGMSCAAGVCLDYYETSMEGFRIERLVNDHKGALGKHTPNLRLLSRLQQVHDRTTRETWEHEFSMVAKYFRLSLALLTGVSGVTQSYIDSQLPTD